MIKQLIILLTAILLFLSACGRSVSPEPSPSPVTVVHSGQELTLLPTVKEPGKIIPTPAKICRYQPELDVNNGVMPEPGTLRWKPVSSGLYQLMQLSVGIYTIDPSPDGRWLAAELVQKTGDMGDADTLLYILDSQNENHWIASLQPRLGWYHRAAWQADGHLVWVDKGQVWRATGDGRDRESLDSPSKMDEVWTGAGGALLASGMGLWQWLPDGLGWTIIDNTPSVSQPSANLSITPDGLFAAVFSAGSLWKVPVTARGPGKYLNRVEYTGTEGRVGAPKALRYNSLWIIPVPIIENGQESFGLINSENGDLVPVTEAFPGTLPGYSWPTTSPDGKWVLVEVKTGLNKTTDGVYIAPSIDLNTGETFHGNFGIQGWFRNETDVLLLETLAEGERFVILPLPKGQLPVKTTPFPVSSQLSISIIESGFAISISENPLEKGNHQLLAYGRDGKQINHIDLPTPVNSYAILTPGKSDTVFVRTINAQGGGDEPCVFTKTLYKWNIGSK